MPAKRKKTIQISNIQVICLCYGLCYDLGTGGFPVWINHWRKP